jgi:hypothetical protein
VTKTIGPISYYGWVESGGQTCDSQISSRRLATLIVRGFGRRFSLAEAGVLLGALLLCDKAYPFQTHQIDLAPTLRSLLHISVIPL